jgi:EREBP-like factor
VGGGGAEEKKRKEKKRKEMRLHASSSPDRSYKSRNIDLNKEPTAWDDNTDDHASSTSCCTGGGGGGGGDSTAPFRGVRHRPELNKWVTEIRPTSQKRKIWLGTYETPQEAARAYDVGIFYTRKKIPYNFPDSPHHLQNQPISPELPWETFAALVKQRATLAAKRHRVNLQEATPAQ